MLSKDSFVIEQKTADPKVPNEATTVPGTVLVAEQGEDANVRPVEQPASDFGPWMIEKPKVSRRVSKVNDGDKGKKTAMQGTSGGSRFAALA